MWHLSQDVPSSPVPPVDNSNCHFSASDQDGGLTCGSYEMSLKSPSGFCNMVAMGIFDTVETLCSASHSGPQPKCLFSLSTGGGGA